MTTSFFFLSLAVGLGVALWWWLDQQARRAEEQQRRGEVTPEGLRPIRLPVRRD